MRVNLIFDNNLKFYQKLNYTKYRVVKCDLKASEKMELSC